MKKIYFACSIRGGRDDQPIYVEVVDIVKKHASVLSEMFTNKSLTARGYEAWTDHKIWKADIALLEKANGIIAEVTNPSLGVGYEIRHAEEKNIPILVLYRPDPARRLSAMIAGSPKVKVVEYEKTSELDKPIAEFINKL